MGVSVSPLDADTATLKLFLQLLSNKIDIIHKGSKDKPLADALARKFLSDTYQKLSESMNVLVHSVMSSIPINNTRWNETRAIMSADPQSLEMKRTIMNKCEYNATVHLKLTYFGISAKSLV